MTWVELLPIIAKYGIEFAYKLWLKLAAGGEPTQTDWDELLGLSRKQAKDKMLAVLAVAGIDPASDAGKMLLGLTTV